MQRYSTKRIFIKKPVYKERSTQAPKIQVTLLVQSILVRDLLKFTVYRHLACRTPGSGSNICSFQLHSEKIKLQPL